MKKFIWAVLGSCALFGCAAAPVVHYPSHAAAVEKIAVHNKGFKGFFASESVHTVSTRDDRRRSEDEFNFSGFVMKHLAKARDAATIWRVDKKLQWRLDLKDKTYVECPLSGCAAQRRAAPSRPQPASEPEGPPKKPSCPLTLAKNKLTVKATGERRTINGFETANYKVDWEVVVEDHKKKKDTSSVKIDIWTAPESEPRIAAARAVDRSFEAALRARRPDESGLGRVIPADAMKILASQFLDGLTAAQRSSALAAARELSKIHGHPILTQVEWYLDGEACADEQKAAPKERSSGVDLTRGLSGLLGSAAQKGAEHEVAQASDKPVFAFDEEVLSWGVDQASDGLFLPPPDFKRVDPR